MAPVILKARRPLLLSPVCFGLLIVGVGPSKLQSPPTDDIEVINRTSTLEQISVKRTEHNHLILLLKNVSSKDLNGYAVEVNGGRITVDISSGDRIVSPGQTTDLEIPFDSPSSDITILAAMFADGSIEGDQATSAELEEWRLGLKNQLIQALSVLDETLGSEDVDAATAIDRLESKLSSLPLESDTAKPYLGDGAQTARDTLSTEIQILRERRLRNGARMQKKRLLDLRERLQRRIGSL